jgi:PST family polysaccharide transporter
VLPLVAVTAAMIYALREPLIVLLLSDQFLPVADVMAMQLVGDVLKVGSWVLAFTMVSHAMTRTFVATEIGFGVLQVALTYLLVHRVGLVGAAYGYAITYAVYWLAMLFVVRGLMVRLRPS